MPIPRLKEQFSDPALCTAVHLCLFWGWFLVTMTAITDDREVARSAVWIVEGSMLYTLIMVSVMILLPGPDQDRYRAIYCQGAF